MTAQFREKLYYKGYELLMCTTPLASYLAKSGKSPEFGSLCTACWRGYTGTWEIDRGRLFLIGLKGYLKNGALLTMSSLFPRQPRVFASWYSGDLRIPRGKMLKNIHMGFASMYEEELIFTIESGKMRKIWICRGSEKDEPVEGNQHEQIMAALAEGQPQKKRRGSSRVEQLLTPGH